MTKSFIGVQVVSDNKQKSTDYRHYFIRVLFSMSTTNDSEIQTKSCLSICLFVTVDQLAIAMNELIITLSQKEITTNVDVVN